MFTQTTEAPVFNPSRQPPKKPVIKQNTEIIAEDITTLLKLLQILIALRAGKTINAE